MSLSNDKYIFISYSHKDSDTVMPIIKGLKKRGFNIWYDSGIEAGTEWPAYIEEMLLGCDAVIAFLSDNYTASKYCRREMTTADDVDKKILAVYLSEVKNTQGLRLQLANSQKMFRERFSDDELFLNELSVARILADCKKESLTESAEAKAEAFDISAAETAEEKTDSVTAPEISEKKVTVGVKALLDGSVYEGELVNGEANGKGKRTFISGAVYEGDFVDFKLNGKGKKIMSYGTVEEGDFINGELNGNGKITEKDGTIKEGDFVDGKLNGKGKYVSDRLTEEGDYINGRLHGEGKIIFSHGMVAEGLFEDGTFKKGKTSLYGCISEGDFVDFKLNGKGKKTMSYGTVEEGDFINGKLNGNGKITEKDGTIKEGDFVDGKLNGKGIITDKYGDVYEGDFVDEKLNGKGKITEKKKVDKGNFTDNRLHGEGERVYIKYDNDLKEVTLRGQWKDGKLLNGFSYDSFGKKIYKYVDGKKKKLGLFGF